MQGQCVPILTERLNKRQAEKDALEEQLAIEENKRICLSEAQILAFLDYVCEMPLEEEKLIRIDYEDYNR